jgi:methionyl-tRNA formyltransferase
MSLRLFFMGTGPFAVPSLKALSEAGHRVELVVCQPDRPSGRGQKVQAPAVKQAALALGLEVFQPEKVKVPEAVARLRSLRADLGCVAAFGQILPQEVLDAPRLGCVNVHASLLPKYRGAAPIAWAIARGERETGVSIQRMVARLDAGDVLVQKTLPLGPQDDTEGLTQALAGLGAEALREALRDLEAGSARLRPQDEAQVTLAPLLKKEDGRVDFSWSSSEIERRCRAFRRWPGCAFSLSGTAFRLHEAALGRAAEGQTPGTLLESGPEGWRVACGQDESIWLKKIQPVSGKVMTPQEYERGHAWKKAP